MMLHYSASTYPCSVRDSVVKAEEPIVFRAYAEYRTLHAVVLRHESDYLFMIVGWHLVSMHFIAES